MGHNTNALARRPVRIYAEGGELIEPAIPVTMPTGPKNGSDSEEPLSDKAAKLVIVEPSKPPARETQESRIAPMVNLGRDLCSMFPSTTEDMGKNVTKSLQAARASDKKVEGRPINFGTVLPKTIYRSSYPQIEDFQFLASLGLKTIVTLVNRDISVDFKAFIRANGIKHIVIDMPGTKKVVIPERIMHSVMEVILEEKNHPLLLHCNQGKHRTGCAIAVLRHVAGWDVNSILEEYRGYAAPKVRENDIQYIMEYQLSSLEGLFTERPPPRARIADRIATGRKILRSLLGSIALVFLLWVFTNSTVSGRL